MAQQARSPLLALDRILPIVLVFKTGERMLNVQSYRYTPAKVSILRPLRQCT